MLNPKSALDAVRTVLDFQRQHEMVRLDRIHDALRPDIRPGEFIPSVQIPDDAPAMMREIARKSRSNYLPLVVKTFAQVMKVDGYQTETDPDGIHPWSRWQRNRMDSRQAGIVRAALAYGTAYATVLRGTVGRTPDAPRVSGFSPRQMTCLYQDPEGDEWPMLAAWIDRTGDGKEYVTLLDEEGIYRFGVESAISYGPPPTLSTAFGNGLLTFIESAPHGFDVTPAVRYQDRNLLSGEQQYGIVEPLLITQERVEERTFQASVALYYTAFQQRYVLGWVPQNEQQELKAGAARIWYLDNDPASVKIDQLASADLSQQVNLRNESLRDMAALGQIPVQTLGIDGLSSISDATLAGLEAAKNREAGEIMTSLGESHEQLLRLIAFADGNQAAADDYSSEARWRNFEARSFAQTVDGLGKLATMLGIPGEDLVEDIPGMTGQRLERIQTDMRRTSAMAVLNRLAPTPAP